MSEFSEQEQQNNFNSISEGTRNDNHQMNFGLRCLGPSCPLNSIIQVLAHLNIFKHYVLSMNLSNLNKEKREAAQIVQHIFFQLHLNKNLFKSINKLPNRYLSRNPSPSAANLLLFLETSATTADESTLISSPIHKILNLFFNNDRFVFNAFIGVAYRTDVNNNEIDEKDNLSKNIFDDLDVNMNYLKDNLDISFVMETNNLPNYNKRSFFLSILLDIYSGNSVSEIILNSFTSKNIRFEHLPPILFFEFNRVNNGKTDHKYVSFENTLTLECNEPDETKKTLTYKLYAIIVGFGNKVRRFYTYINDSRLTNWRLFDDTKVCDFSASKVLEENFGGKSQTYSAAVLVYIDSEMKDIIFSSDNDIEISPSLAKLKTEFEESSIQNDKNKNNEIDMNEDSDKNDNAEKIVKINVVQVDDLDEYTSDESNIKFRSSLFIKFGENISVRELYIKMANLLKTKYDKLTIWVLMHSIPYFKITHKYDKEILKNLIGTLDDVKFFVEESGSISDADDEESDDSSDKNSIILNKKNEKGSIFYPSYTRKKGVFKDEADCILVFLYFYDNTDHEPLQFIGTVTIKFQENIESLFSVARSHYELDSDLKMLAYQIIGQNCRKVENTEAHISDINLSNGAIIVVQPCYEHFKSYNFIRIKKPKSTHGIFSYYPDFISCAPLEFENYFDFRNNPYILLLRYNNLRKMVQFPKYIHFDDFKNFILKALNITLESDYEDILFYSKNSTKPIIFIRNTKIGCQLDKYKDRLLNVNVIREKKHNISKLFRQVRLRMKFISPEETSKKIGFYDENISMISLIGILQKENPNFFITPYNSNNLIIPEHILLKNIRNPIFLKLTSKDNIESSLVSDENLKINVIIIKNGQKYKDSVVNVKENENFFEFKNRIDFSYVDKIDPNAKINFYKIIHDNTEKVEMRDEEIMTDISKTKSIIEVDLHTNCEISVKKENTNGIIFNAKYISNVSKLNNSLPQLYYSSLSKSNKENKTIHSTKNGGNITSNLDRLLKTKYYSAMNDHEFCESESTINHLKMVQKIIKDDSFYKEILSVDQLMKEKIEGINGFTNVFGQNNKQNYFPKKINTVFEISSSSIVDNSAQESNTIEEDTEAIKDFEQKPSKFPKDKSKNKRDKIVDNNSYYSDDSYETDYTKKNIHFQSDYDTTDYDDSSYDHVKTPKRKRRKINSKKKFDSEDYIDKNNYNKGKRKKSISNQNRKNTFKKQQNSRRHKENSSNTDSESESLSNTTDYNEEQKAYEKNDTKIANDLSLYEQMDTDFENIQNASEITNNQNWKHIMKSNEDEEYPDGLVIFPSRSKKINVDNEEFQVGKSFKNKKYKRNSKSDIRDSSTKRPFKSKNESDIHSRLRKHRKFKKKSEWDDEEYQAWPPQPKKKKTSLTKIDMDPKNERKNSNESSKHDITSPIPEINTHEIFENPNHISNINDETDQITQKSSTTLQFPTDNLYNIIFNDDSENDVNRNDNYKTQK